MPTALVILAQSPAATRDQAMGILIGLSIVVGAAIIAAIGGFVIWRRYTRGDEVVTPQSAFTLADLRKLHREGQLSDEEFERAKTAIIAQTRAALAPREDTDGSPEADKPGDEDEPDHSR